MHYVQCTYSISNILNESIGISKYVLTESQEVREKKGRQLYKKRNVGVRTLVLLRERKGKKSKIKINARKGVYRTRPY